MNAAEISEFEFRVLLRKKVSNAKFRSERARRRYERSVIRQWIVDDDRLFMWSAHRLSKAYKGLISPGSISHIRSCLRSDTCS